MAIVIFITLAGCAPGFTPPPRPAPSSLPQGSPLASRTLSDAHAWLRHYLMVGEYDAALDLLARSGELGGDKLLRQLQAGVVLHHAGRYEESNLAFEWAEREVDRRYTKSVSRAAGSLLVSDGVLAYAPAPAELAAIPYYRMLNYLALGNSGGAAVEARKAGALMSRIGENGEACVGNAFVQYLSGLVFGTVGATNDALVSFRQAEHSFDACAMRDGIPLPDPLGRDLLRSARALGMHDLVHAAESRYGEVPAPTPHSATGELVVLIEHGFVAHRAEEALHIPIFGGDTTGLHSDNSDGISLAASRIGSRTLDRDPAYPAGSSVLDDRSFLAWYGAEDVVHVLRLAWPVFRSEASRVAAVRVVVDSIAIDATPVLDQSALLMRDLESQRALLASRMIARGLVKYLLTQEIEDRVEEEGGETAGFLAGLFVNTAANLLERADTRSWSLLPDGVSMARVRLPAGKHRVRLDVLGPDGASAGTIDLGVVEVGVGERVFLSRRVWGTLDGNEEF